MSRKFRTFNHDVHCRTVDGTVTVGGSLIAPRDSGACLARITYCTGVMKCGARLPKVASEKDCAAVGGLCR